MIRGLAFGVVAGVTLALVGPASAGDVTLKVTTCLARNHDYTQAFLQTFVEPINAKKADVKLTYLGGPEVTPFKEQGVVAQARAGRHDPVPGGLLRRPVRRGAAARRAEQPRSTKSARTAPGT